MIPQPATPGATFPDRAALKAAVDNCIAVDPTGVACCSHGADCGAAGTVEMADWDVSLVTSMSSCSTDKGSFNADISRWDTSSVTNMQSSEMDGSTRSDHEEMFPAYAFNQHLSRWDVSSVTTMRYMFYDANAFNTMPVGWDTSKVTDSIDISILQTHGMPGSRAAVRHPPRSRVDAQGQRVRRVLAARQRRRRQLHRHPRERHVLRPRRATPGTCWRA